MSFEEIFGLKVRPGKLALVWFNSYSGIIVKTPGMSNATYSTQS